MQTRASRSEHSCLSARWARAHTRLPSRHCHKSCRCGSTAMCACMNPWVASPLSPSLTIPQRRIGGSLRGHRAVSSPRQRNSDAAPNRRADNRHVAPVPRMPAVETPRCSVMWAFCCWVVQSQAQSPRLSVEGPNAGTDVDGSTRHHSDPDIPTEEINEPLPTAAQLLARRSGLRGHTRLLHPSRFMFTLCAAILNACAGLLLEAF